MPQVRQFICNSSESKCVVNKLLSKLCFNFRFCKIVAERPWLLEEVFPQRKVVDSRLPQDLALRDAPREDEPKRVIEPADIEESKIAQEALFVQEPFVIFEKTIKPDDEEIDFEKRELVERVTIEEDEIAEKKIYRITTPARLYDEPMDDEEIGFEERELVVERVTTEEDRIVGNEIDRMKLRDEPTRVIEPVDVQEPRIDQEPSIAKQPIVTPTERVDKDVDVVAETRKPVAEKIVIEPTEKVPVTSEEAEAVEIDRTPTPAEFELKTDAEPRLPRDKPTRRIELRDKKEDDEFIDEKMQKSLPAVTAKQILEEEEEEEAKTKQREKIPIKDTKIDREELAGPSVPVRHRIGVEDRGEFPIDSTMEAVSGEPVRTSAPAASEDTCDDTCPLIDKQKGELLTLTLRETFPGGSASVLSHAVVLIFPPGKAMYTVYMRIHHFTVAIRLLQNALCANWRNVRGS